MNIKSTPMTPISDKDRDGIRRMVETGDTDRIKLAYNLCLSFGMTELEAFEHLILSAFSLDKRRRHTWTVYVEFETFTFGIKWIEFALL